MKKKILTAPCKHDEEWFQNYVHTTYVLFSTYLKVSNDYKTWWKVLFDHASLLLLWINSRMLSWTCESICNSGLFRVLNRWVLIAFDPRPPWPRPPVQGPPAHVTFSPQIKCPVLHAAQLLSHINWIFAFYCSGKMLLLMYHINLLIPKSSLLLGNFAANMFATSARIVCTYQ